MRSRLLLLIPVALALGPGLPDARAQKPTPEILTTAQLQEHVERYLVDPLKQAELTELRRQLELDTRRLTYDAADRRATWRPRPTASARLTAEQRARLEGQLEERLRNVVENYNMGLLRAGSGPLRYSIEIAPRRLTLESARTEDFRRQLRNYLATRPVAAERLRTDVDLEPEGLTYSGRRLPGALTWRVRAQRELNQVEQDRVRAEVLDLLFDALEYDGGLLERDDLAVLRPLARVEVLPYAPAQPVQAVPTGMVTVTAKFFFPNYCHGYLVGWCYEVPIQVPMSMAHYYQDPSGYLPAPQWHAPSPAEPMPMLPAPGG
jgi:hypothetical protein